MTAEREVVGAGHLRLVRDEDVARELRNAEQLRAAARLDCQGITVVADLPSGAALPSGHEFTVVCTLKGGHPGYCRDETGIGFTPNTNSLHVSGPLARGKVVYWNNFTDEDILDLARELAEG